MESVDISLADLPLYAFILALVRVSAIVMLLPGIGEGWVPSRARIGIAVGLALLISSAGAVRVPAGDGFTLAVTSVMAEAVTGLVLGGITRFFLVAPTLAGQLTSQVGSLSNIFTHAGMPMDTSSVLSVWFMVGAIMFIFVSGLHYLMIEMVVTSYQLVPAGRFPVSGDAAEQAVMVFAGVFALGIQMSIPFILLGLIFNLGVGLVNKMLPTLPVYFIAMPLSILGLIYVLGHAVAPLLAVYRSAFQSWLMAPFT